jgi:hypothetical protein
VQESEAGLQESVGSRKASMRHGVRTQQLAHGKPRKTGPLPGHALFALIRGQDVPALALHTSSNEQCRRGSNKADAESGTPLIFPLNRYMYLEESSPHRHFRTCILTLGSPRSLRFCSFSCRLLRPSCLGSSSPTADDRPSNMGEMSTFHSL